MRLALFIFFTLLFARVAEAKITIYACEPEWGSLAKEIVGKKAEILNGTSALENPATKRVTTGLTNVVRAADMVFCTGGGLEKKWLMRAINDSDNARVSTNPDSLFLVYGDAASARADVPRPHLNPHNIPKIAAEFTRRVKALDGINAAFYEKSYNAFITKWQKYLTAWEKAAAPLKGMRVVIHNDSWMELVNWLGLEVAAKIETEKSYIKNNQRLNEIARELQANPAAAIIFANYEDKKPVMWLSEKTKTRVILLPFTVGGAANSANLFSLYTTTINLLLVDCSRSLCPKISILPAVSNK